MRQPISDDSRLSKIAVEIFAAVTGTCIGRNRFKAVKVGIFVSAIAALGLTSVKSAGASEPVAPQGVTISQGLPNRNTQILPGEILLTGDMLSVDATSGKIIIRAKSFQTSTGGIRTVDNKEKIITLDSDSRIYRYGAPDAEISLFTIPKDYRPNDVKVIGTNLPSNELKAREVILPKDGTVLPSLLPKDAKPEIIAASSTLPASIGKPKQPVVQPHQSQELEQLAKEQFGTFASVLGISNIDVQSATLENHGTFVLVKSQDWMYRMDMFGNQVFKPISNVAALTSAFAAEPMDHMDSDTDIARLKSLTYSYASSLGYKQEMGLSKIVLKRELLMIGKCAEEDSWQVNNGGYLTRVYNHDLYFQVRFDSDYNPLRIDSNLLDASGKRLKDLIYLQVINGAPTLLVKDDAQNLRIATFFDSTEYRFEMESFSWEGLDFLNVRSSQNSFEAGNYSAAPEILVNGQFSPGWNDPVDVHFERYQSTDDAKHWQFCSWERNGRIGGIRGDFNSESQHWDRSDVTISHHRLDSYSRLGEEPKETRDFVFANNRNFTVPYAVCQQLESRFYQDLEAANIGVISTHAGDILGELNFRQTSDIWFKLNNQESKLGSGNLRHLFFNSCGTLGAFTVGDDVKILLKDWMPAAYVNGLRTVCGIDGGAATSGQTGWRYFGHYYSGDSISDAWRQSAIDEDPNNDPVTVSYSGTRQGVIKSLGDDRFSTEKAIPTWVASSSWKTIESKSLN